MPAVIWAILSAFFRRAAVWALAYIVPLLVKGLLAFGLSFVSYKLAVGPFVHMIQSALSGVSAIVVDSLAGLNFDKAVTIILSAHAVRASSRLVLQRATPSP